MPVAWVSANHLRYRENFITAKQADEMLCWLLGQSSISWQREQFSIFGKSTAAPRQLAWYGDAGINYRYTGIDHVANGWPSQLIALKQKVEQCTGLSFNFVLMNRYDHGAEYMGWHRDDERAADPMIASLSVGAVRRFRIAAEVPAGGPADSLAGTGHPGKQAGKQTGKQNVEHIDLQSGSLLTFDGRRRHQLSKTRRAVGTRINLTFRYISNSQAGFG